tara:strand:+ start:759 stop:1196 length:438 start_codon:yes stop_codon:yes gene_type:complete
MAYFIFENNYLSKIAANDADKNSLNLSPTAVVKSVSDTDFEEVRQLIKRVSLFDGTNITYEVFEITGETPIPNEDDAKLGNKGVIKIMNDFLQSNSSNSMYSAVSDYKNYLESFDYSTITYPMTVSWEKYCSDNSITFFHPLQIP